MKNLYARFFSAALFLKGWRQTLLLGLLLSLYLITPTHAQQDYVWAKRMGGSTGDYGQAIAVDGSGNVYTTGYFTGTTDFDPSDGTVNLTSAGSNDIFITKFDASGNLVWAKRMGGSADEQGLGIGVDGSGNVYTAGYFAGTADFDPGAGTVNLTSAGNNDIFVSKLDASGTYVWAKRMGGTNNDQGYGLTLDGSGNVYTTGFFYATADFDPGAATANIASSGLGDIFISKLDASGNYVWAKRMGGSSLDMGRSLALDGSGNIYITGNFYGTTTLNPAGTTYIGTVGGADIFISKFDASGNYVWGKTMGGTGDDMGYSIATDGSGNIYTTGYFNSSVNFGLGAVASAGGNDIFVNKFDASGAAVWTKRMGGTGEDRGYSLLVDGSGSVHTTGYFSSTADFDPGAGTANLTSAGSNDIFLSKLDASGSYVWAKNMGGSGDDKGQSIAVDGSSNVYSTGYFNGTADFDPGAGTANLVSAGSGDIFVSKLGTPCSLTVSIDATPSLLITSGTSATLTASAGASAGATTYKWSTGETTASISVSLAGTYSVVGVTAACSATAQVQTVGVEEPISLTTTASSGSICINSPISLSGIASGGATPYSYIWSAPTGITLAGNSTSTVLATASTSGVYTLTLTVAGSGTIAASSSTVSFTANALPNVSISATPSLSLAKGGRATLTASAGPSDGVTSYSWSTGETTASISINTTGPYSVTALGGTCPATTSAEVVGGWATTNIATGSASAVVLSASNCPAKATLVGSGNRFLITGPGGYKVNALFRTAVINQSFVISGISQPGTYVFAAYGSPGLPPATTTFEVTGKGCIPGKTQSGRLAATTLASTGKTLDTTPLSLSLSPASGAYTVGQSVTATFSGGQADTDYVLMIYDDASYDNDLSSYVTTTSSTTGQNTITWQTGQTNGQFEIQFGPGSEGNNRVLEVTDPTFDHVADSRSFDISPCSLTMGIGATPSLTIAQGQSATLTASTETPIGVDSFLWSTGETTASISTSTAGTYSVTGTTGGCSATASVALSVTATAPCTPPIATITTNSLPYLTCTNFTVSLLAGGGTSYTFSTGATQTGGPTSNTASVTTAGVYSVTVADATGCTSVTTINVTTNYTTPTLTLSASSTTFCTGTRVTLTVGGGDYYTFSAGASQNGPNTAFVTTGGTYTVTANNGLTGCKDTKTISLTSIDLPTVSIAADPGLAIPASGSATLTASGGDTYLWSTGASSAIITTNIGGTYSVTATTSACSAATSLTLTGADLSPTLVLPQANFASGATNNFLVSLFEVNHLPTSLGAVLITVTAPVGYTLSFDNALTSMAVTGASVADGPATVSNANWTVTNTIENRQLSLLIKAGQSIASGATMNLGFSITRTTANSGSTANITVNIADDVTKGYDANAGNNVYARIINGL